jgi:hypothetical protein
VAKIESLSGDVDKDGLDRFEVDWFETSEWTRDLLESMMNDAEYLKSMTKPYSAVDVLRNPLCVKSVREYTYDFSKPQSTGREVEVMFDVDGLGLSENEKHKLLVLAGDLYDREQNIVALKRDDGDVIELSRVVDELINEVKVIDILFINCRIQRIQCWIFH